jgi:DNA (cytosine-5)-methyltransferase 1
MNLSIFDILYPKYKITKPIRLIEFFAGYGSQALALKYLGVEFEHWKICEWAIKSIQAYKDIHFADVNTDYSKDLTVEEIRKYLFNKGISSNYNEPMNKQQVNRLNENQIRTIYNNIKTTNNLVNIQQVKGKDLEIKDIDKYDYILTYSFPCQDLSLAGKGKGMSDTSTRSGMLWEVERILTECHELGTLPQILLMENVPQVHGTDNVQDFNKWQLRLEELGYKNYFQDLIATDYGIPQTRNRCFMISILGDYSYTFPKPVPLKLKLKDMLEDNVDEKYYLSDKMINYISSRMPTGNNKITTGINMGNKETFNKAGTITTGEGSKPSSNYIIDNKNYDYSKEKGKVIKIKNATQTNDLRIRKLTPKECFRLMGVKDEDYEKVRKNQSDSSLYHLAGDSIVVNVLMAIFKELLY